MSAKTKYGFRGYDFSEGVDISDKEIRKWINQIKKALKVERWYYIGSGNTMVFGTKGEDEESDEIDIYVCKNYFSISKEYKKDKSIKIEPETKAHKILKKKY